MDKDFVTRDDPIGFVEFCVADLEPNGPEVRGWLELRKMEHFQSTAKRRFMKHRRRRDDNCTPEDEVQKELQEEFHDDWEEDMNFSSAVRHLNGGLARSVSKAAKAAETVKSEVKSQLKRMQTRVINAHPPRPIVCCSGWKNETDEKTGFLKWRKKRLNAGELEVSLQLETTMQSSPNNATPKHELLYTAVFAPERTPATLLLPCFARFAPALLRKHS